MFLVSVVPGFVNFISIVYDNDVAEDGDTKCVYTYKLLEDYKNGDLEIVLEVTAWWKFKVVGCWKQCLISTFNTVHAEAHFLKSLFLFSVVCLRLVLVLSCLFTVNSCSQLFVYKLFIPLFC